LTRKRLLIAALIVVLVAAGAVGAYVINRWLEGRDVRGSSSVEFVTTAGPTVPTHPKRSGIDWPMYGYDQQRTRVGPGRFRPPFRRKWVFGARNLVEFPPAVAYDRLFFTNNSGVLFAVGTKTGGRAWRWKSGRCAASSPAVSGQLVIQVFLARRPCNRTGSSLNGLVAAFYAGSGKVRWKRIIGPSETSPLVAEGRVFVGDWNGNVWALNANTGAVLWRFHAGGQVKSGIAYSSGRLFFGCYDHHVYSLNAHTGRLVWRASAQQRLGSQATFYSTPAVAYGRVYIGGTDGKMYSFGAASGKLRWSQSTGGYVYSSPAVWERKVYVGSYDHYFYCLDAATGDVRWRFRSNGPISGSAVVINGVVYFSSFKGRTYALDARTGKLLWYFRRGKYGAVVTDKKWLYLVGYARVFSMRPTGGRR
jgi:outer membrane protein assembly factor BamB